MRAMKNVRGGFTLIELLAVILVIAILMGLLLPVVSKARARGQVFKCRSNLHQLQLAAMNYAIDHQVLPHSKSFECYDTHENVWYRLDDPGGERWVGWVDWYQYNGGTDVPGNGDTRTYWWGDKARSCILRGTLYDYVRDLDIFLCPTFGSIVRKDGDMKSFGADDAVRSYVMNASVSGVDFFVLSGANSQVFFADGGLELEGWNWSLRKGPKTGSGNDWSVPNPLQATDECYSYYKEMDGELEWSGNNEHIGEYHDGKGNCVFFDGHVEAISYSDTAAACQGNWGD